MKRMTVLAALCLCALLLLCGAAAAELQINEVLVSNGYYENGYAWGWAEIKNTGSEEASLAGLTLTYTRKDEKAQFTFPDKAKIKAGGYALVHFVGTDPAPKQKEKGPFYAPMEPSRKGGRLALENGAETLSAVEYPAQHGNISYGKAGDEAGFCFFYAPTPGEKNAAAGCAERAANPEFSLKGGLYTGSVTVKLLGSGGEIRYTLDGSEPTEDSALYGDEMTFTKNACLRARVFEDGKLPSEAVTQTYLIDVPYEVTVVSLVTDEKYLFSSKTGILVPGNGSVKNYERDWEYPINVEIYTPGKGQEIDQIATFRVTGATSRKFGQKTLSIYARSAWGEKTFAFNPFQNREDYEGYKSLTLRACGTECFMTRFRDAMLSSRAADLNILYQEAVPTVVYINGEYWGHYNLREKINKHMIAQFEDITDDAVMEGITIIKGRGEVTMGTIDEWSELISFLKKKDLNDPENLKWVTDRLDADNYFIHTAIEMIIGNSDIGNVRYYKVPGGKWKCALYDLDSGMETLNKGPISYYNKTPKQNSQLFYHEPFAALMKVPQMRARFLELFGQVLLRYLPDDLNAEIDQWEAVMEPLMADQIARWPKCSVPSVANWKYEVNSLRKICRQRPEKALEMLISTYHVTKEEKARYFTEFYAAIGK